MGTQSHRSNGLLGPYDGGTAGIQSNPWTASVPLGDEFALVKGTRTYMTSSCAIHVSAGDGRIAILHDRLRLILRCRARLPDIDHARNPLIAHMAIGSQEKPGCSREHAL